MEDLLPPEIIWRRRKMGFPFPIESWLDLHRDRILGLLAGTSCPFIDIEKLADRYEALRRRNSNYLSLVPHLDGSLVEEPPTSVLTPLTGMISL